MDNEDYNMIKGNEYNNNFESQEIREKFITNYCNKRGWDKNNLNEKQLNEIKKQKEYKNPGLILG